MANQFVNLPAAAADGPGAAVDVSTFGALKTVLVTGSWSLPNRAPAVTIEINNAAVSTDGTWSPLATFQGGQPPKNFLVAARWMRANVSNYRGGQAPVINVGGTDDGTSFVNLPVTAGDGTGAPVNISALPTFKTVQVGSGFSGSLIVEVSEDAAGAEYGQSFFLTAPGQQSLTIEGYWARVKRAGTTTPVGTPVVNMGATSPSAGGGGSGGTFQELRLTPAISPAALAAGETNNYSPANFLTTSRVRQATNIAGSSLSGLGAASDGDVRFFENLGPGTLTFENENTNSTAANRITCPGSVDITLSIYGAAILVYDGTTSRWKIDAIAGLSTASSTFQEIALTPAASPAALAAGTTNDYNPTGFSTSSRLRQATNVAGSAISGFVAQNSGDIRIVQNLGPGTLTLLNEDAGSTATNRITCPGGVSQIVPAGGAFFLIYDATTSRWVSIAIDGGGAPIVNTLLVNTTLTSDGLAVIYQSRFGGYFARNSATSPAALAAGNTNNYDISAAMLGANRIRQATNVANSVVTGMVPIGVNGAEWLLINLGPGTLTLKNEDAGSTAANRFALGGADRVMQVNAAVLISYDNATARWYVVG